LILDEAALVEADRGGEEIVVEEKLIPDYRLVKPIHKENVSPTVQKLLLALILFFLILQLVTRIR